MKKFLLNVLFSVLIAMPIVVLFDLHGILTFMAGFFSSLFVDKMGWDRILSN